MPRDSVQPWSKRYYRVGRTKGEELYLLEKTAIRGVWTCVTPRLVVTTVNLNASSGVSTSPKDGVNYLPMP
eukprot:2286169-Alexandrium_andersonii.AAC.1